MELEDIRTKIYTIRNLQVMLDGDLAIFYNIETKVLNQAVKRNIERFPPEFMFQLTESEFNILRSQIVTSSSLRSQIVTLDCLRSQNATLENRGKHRKFLPYVFTEQGVAMLSGILRSEIAVKISIRIMSAFVEMRRLIPNRLNRIETKLLVHDEKFDKLFDALQVKEPDKGIFFDGQIFDSYKFVSDIIRTANQSIILIDNYVDDSVLTLFSKRKKDVTVKIFTKGISKQLELDVKRYNSQYPRIEINEFGNSHDRFLIIDEQEIYPFGASLKDLGKKWFAFSRFDKEILKVLVRLKLLDMPMSSIELTKPLKESEKEIDEDIVDIIHKFRKENPRN